MFQIARLLYRRDKEDTRNVKILNHVHTTLPNLSKRIRISLTDIRVLSEKMNVSSPSVRLLNLEIVLKLRTIVSVNGMVRSKSKKDHHGNTSRKY